MDFLSETLQRSRDEDVALATSDFRISRYNEILYFNQTTSSVQVLIHLFSSLKVGLHRVSEPITATRMETEKSERPRDEGLGRATGEGLLYSNGRKVGVRARDWPRNELDRFG